MSTKKQKDILNKLSGTISAVKQAHKNNDQDGYEYGIRAIDEVIETEYNSMPMNRRKAIGAMWNRVDTKLGDSAPKK